MKAALLIFVIGIISSFYLLGGNQYLTLDYIQNHLLEVHQLFLRQPYLVAGIFCAVNIGLISLSIPGGIVLTLLSGAIFGVGIGTALVVLSATIGAAHSFLIARYILRDWIENRFQTAYTKINRQMLIEGRSYLLVLRMIPISPFIVVNNVMGLTSLKLWTYCYITFLGMLPGTLVYVYAGQKISEIETVSQILSLPVLVSLGLIGLMPLLTKKIVTLYRKKHRPEVNP